MFEGIFFQFPKLGFLLFFYLGCETLCPLRSNPIYFPRIARFSEVGVKVPIWLWIAKWAMIICFIIALMSPVKEHPILTGEGGDDILIVLDPASADRETLEHIERFVGERNADRIGLWVPDTVETLVPLTREHAVLISMLRQLHPGKTEEAVTRRIERFFADSAETAKWAIVVSDAPKSFVRSLPTEIRLSVVAPSEKTDWVAAMAAEFPPYDVRSTQVYFDFYYFYPLFLGFLAMLAYLYGRNQKGLR